MLHWAQEHHGDQHADGQFTVLGSRFTSNFNPTPFTPIRVDAGGGSYTDTSSQTWSPDNSFTGGNIASTASSVSNTSDPALYQTERYGNFNYQFTVPNGNYNVLLKFAEIYWTGAGQRTFNVSINGTQVLTISASLRQLVERSRPSADFPVTVTGGSITIQFSTGTADLPKISAIQIAQSGAYRCSHRRLPRCSLHNHPAIYAALLAAAIPEWRGREHKLEHCRRTDCTQRRSQCRQHRLCR